MESETQNMDLYNYYYFNEVFNPNELNEIIKTCESLPKQIVTEGYESTDDSIRRSEISYLDYNDDNHWIFERVYEYINQSNIDMGWNFDIDGIESSIEYSVYYDNSGHFNWYCDMLLDNNNNKLIAYLDLSTKEEYKGGDLQINLGSTISDVDSNVGTLTIFPTYLLHRVTPIMSGVKRSLIIRATGKSFR